MKKILSKLFKSTERNDFSEMSLTKKLETVRDDVEKNISTKNIKLTGLKRK